MSFGLALLSAEGKKSSGRKAKAFPKFWLNLKGLALSREKFGKKGTGYLLPERRRKRMKLYKPDISGSKEESKSEEGMAAILSLKSVGRY